MDDRKVDQLIGAIGGVEIELKQIKEELQRLNRTIENIDRRQHENE